MALIKVRFKPLFGKSVSFSNKKTKRKFGINYKRVKLWSFVLKRFVKLKTSAKLLKTIKRYGGIDFYIVNFKRLPKQFVKLKMALVAAVLE
ncbi:MAG: 50S ribosomal protein L28 [Candidatus Hodgkinia cicadicola]|nr:MAG: 50S ribosomal protein L28 [Candidatus Hodgkinia cicadicola]